MAERDELAILQSLSAARDAGDMRAELEALRALRAIQPAQPTQPEMPAPSVGRRAAARFLSNALGLPSGIGELMDLGDSSEMLGVPRNPIDKTVSSALQAIPSPNPEQILAATETIKRTPQIMRQGMGNMQLDASTLFPNPAAGLGMAMGRAVGPAVRSEFGNQLQMQQAQAQQHPIATGAGDTLGDIGSILSARPLTRKPFRSARAREVISDETIDVIDGAANRLARVTGFAKRLGAQAGEAGFEGALLAAVGDGDPVATAGWAAGTQAGGSFALQGLQAFRKYPFRTMGAIMIGHGVWRSLAPGAQGPVEEMRDEAVNGAITAFGLGTLAALAGAGRMAPGRTVGRDRFIDSFDTIRRGWVQSVVSQLSEAEESGDTSLGTVLGKLAEDPDYFGREARIRIERASRSDKDNALIREVDRLMKSERFRRLFDEI